MDNFARHENCLGNFNDTEEIMLSNQQIRRIIAERNSKVDWDAVDNNTTFEELGIDSLDRFDIILGLQEASNFEVPDDDVEHLQSIASIESYFANK